MELLEYLVEVGEEDAPVGVLNVPDGPVERRIRTHPLLQGPPLLVQLLT
jgi:hypothetical protein